ncbi:MAG: hypothetical protein ACFCVA_10975 [Gammaproteobacteria bacterium]
MSNLNPSGLGSLRACVDAKGPRTCVFEVGGEIPLTGELKIQNPYLTIAGQTAPWPGITLTNHGMLAFTNDVLIQHIRIRPGCRVTKAHDAAGVNAGYRDVYNVVYDHVSVSWSGDENIGHWSGNNKIYKVDYLDSIIAEPLNSCHSKPGHAVNMLIQEGQKDISVTRSLFAHALGRNPHARSGSIFFGNNVIYNTRHEHTALASTRGPVVASVVGNIYMTGPSYMYNTPIMNDGTDTTLYLEGNVEVGFKESNHMTKGGVKFETPWDFVGGATPVKVKGTSPPIWPKGYQLIPSSQHPKQYNQVLDYVLQNSGARRADKDPVDERIIESVVKRSGKIIETEADVGGYPQLKPTRHKLNIPANPNRDDNGDGYTNLENWLHELALKVQGGSQVSKLNPPTKPEPLRLQVQQQTE